MSLLPGMDVSKQIGEFRKLLVEIRDLLRDVRDYQKQQAESVTER